eukprot:c54483_g1_i1 orf=68-343(+)
MLVFFSNKKNNSSYGSFTNLQGIYSLHNFNTQLSKVFKQVDYHIELHFGMIETTLYRMCCHSFQSYMSHRKIFSSLLLCQEEAHMAAAFSA